MSSDASQEKAKLREVGRKRKIDPNERTRLSHLICSFIKESSVFKKAPQVALYAARANEVDVFSLWDCKRSVFPRVENDDLVFYRVESLKDLRPGFAGILEPPPNPALRKDAWSKDNIVIVPGCAFDKKGGRLGSGKGFYDRFLSKVNATPWGCTFAAQMVNSVPIEPFDVSMRALVTELGLEFL